jgi:alkylation response protein AidB-like acyl-CoA dehydrogenase
MGARLLPTSPIYLEDVRVPADYILGPKPGGAYEAGKPHATLVLLLKCTILLGAFQALYDEAVKYARERETCGKPIIENDTIKVMLAEMRGITEASRGLVWKLAWTVEKYPENVKDNLEMAWLTKAMTCEWAMKVFQNADEIHGGMGTSKELVVEKIIRDAFTLLHGHNNRMFAYTKGAPTLE